MDLNIVTATRADLPAVAAVTVQSWQMTFKGLLPEAFLSSLTVEGQLARHHKLFSNPGVCYYIAQQSNEVVGFASGGPNRNLSFTEPNELYALYLLPDSQRQGVGRRLLVSVARQLQTPARQGLLALVLSDNPHRQFYDRCGGQRQAAAPIELGGRLWPVDSYHWHQDLAW